MYNFYTLNPNNQPKSPSEGASVSLDINIPLTNNTFYTLFNAYTENPTEHAEDLLAEHINSIDYLIGIIPDENNASANLQTLSINTMDDLNFLICTTEDREVFLPAFTDSRELTAWYPNPLYTLKVPALWLWKFVLQQGNFNGIVFNPGSACWDISLEHIQSLLDDLT